MADQKHKRKSEDFPASSSKRTKLSPVASSKQSAYVVCRAMSKDDTALLSKRRDDHKSRDFVVNTQPVPNAPSSMDDNHVPSQHSPALHLFSNVPFRQTQKKIYRARRPKRPSGTVVAQYRNPESYSELPEVKEDDSQNASMERTDSDVMADADDTMGPPMPSSTNSSLNASSSGSASMSDDAAVSLRRTTSASFEALLGEFASMNFSPTQMDQCPLCTLKFPLQQFAMHVYQCLQVFDDEALARKLQEEENHRAAPNTFRGAASGDAVRMCKFGIDCRKKTNYHFKAFIHPKQHPLAVAVPEDHPECPGCHRRIPFPLLQTHTNKCLDPNALVASMDDLAGATMEDDGDGDNNMGDSSKVVTAPQPNDPAASSSLPFSSVSASSSSSSSSSAAASSQNSVFGQMRDASQVSFADDDDDDDEKDPAAPGLHLTTEQISAVASLALTVKASEEKGATSSGGYANILNEFSRLGITEENLKAARDQAKK